MIKKEDKETVINGEAVRVITIYFLGIKKIYEEINTTTNNNAVNTLTPKKRK